MPRKFVLIDHSLQDLGGHHYPYAFSVLQAAQLAGWEPVLVTNRRFRDRAALPADWQVLPLFPNASYSRYTLDTQAQPVHATSARAGKSWWQGLQALLGTRARARLTRSFATSCAELFRRVTLQPGDLVFMATTSELDLAGLSSFLAGSGLGRDLDWHLQFHFGVFQGRDPDYGAQGAAAARMSAALAAALRPLHAYRLHCYCTTEQLTAQYRRLGVAAFSTLPYPVHELFSAPHAQQHTGKPARIACLGHARREKGYGQLAQLLEQLWADWFGAGRAQLVLQTHRNRQRAELEALVAAHGTAGQPAPPALAFAGFPLALAEYAQLLRSADIGLMLYDGERYYARCSGVLLEMLVAGVPVLVPAGSWLSEQIEAENQLYLARVAVDATGSEGLGGAAPPGAALPLPGTIELPLEAQRSALLVELRRPDPVPTGTYLRCELLQHRAGAGAPHRSSVIVGAAPGGGLLRMLFRLEPETKRVELQIRPAWHEGPECITELRCLPLGGEAPPLGAIGLAFAGPEAVGEALRDMLQHLPHYRRAAGRFAASCARLHSAARIVALLAAAAPAAATHFAAGVPIAGAPPTP